MATLKKTRSAQWPLVASFTFNYNDTATDVNGVTKDFGLTETADIVFDAISLPVGAVVVGGDVVVESAYVGPTAATVSVGDSGSATRYASAVDMKTAARTALTLTGYHGAGEDIRLTLSTTVAAASAGTVTVRVMYTIDGRANEVQPA